MLASEVPVNKRLLQCASAIFFCLLAGGPIFGFAALKPVLLKEKVYEYVCEISTDPQPMWASLVLDPANFGAVTMALAGAVTEEETIVATCKAQDMKLNMMFTLGAMLTNVLALVIGKCLDNYGPRVCALVGAGFLYLACFVFSASSWLSDNFSFFDPYLIGYACMALGGPFAFMSTFQLSNTFPKRSGTILALVTGAFDASLAVFLMYRLAYNALGSTFTLAKFFRLYLLVPTFITVVQVLLMPATSYETGPETTLCVDDALLPTVHAHTTDTDALLAETAQLSPDLSLQRRDSIGDALKQPYALEGEQFLIERSGGVFGILHGYSAHYQLRSPWFYYICMFATIQMLRINYFVATIGTQYTYLLDSVEKGTLVNRVFDVALPFGGIVAIPIIGMFLDNCSTVAVVLMLLFVSLTIGVLGLIPNIYTGFMNIALFVGFRPFFYTAISDVCAKVFGFDTFGTVYGSIICVSGIINFSQSFLDRLTHTTFQMNPTPINSVLVLVTLGVAAATTWYVRSQALIHQNKRANSSSYGATI